jgi:pilus assembly protein CpaB
MVKLRWQSWPAGALPANAIHRATGAPPPAFTTAPARHPLTQGEPVTEEKLARPGEGGVMAGLIAPGMRAVAVPLRDDSAAGGFIQPHDRVDVIWTPRISDNGKTDKSARTLLHGAKVLAIGKTLQPRATASGDGRNATLELTPAQARIVADARAGGEITLTLIGAGDSETTSASSAEDAGGGTTVRMLKFGRQSLAGTPN